MNRSARCFGFVTGPWSPHNAHDGNSVSGFPDDFSPKRKSEPEKAKQTIIKELQCVHSWLPRTSPSTARSRGLETGSTPRCKGDQSDLLEELHRQDSQSDAFLTGRQTFEDLRSYWPKQLDDAS